MEFIDLILKYLVVPVMGFVWFLYNKIQEDRDDLETRVQHQSTELAVLRATTTANKEAHDREFKAMQESFKAVMAKLDSIEQALRK